MKVGSLMIATFKASVSWRCVIYVGEVGDGDTTKVYLLGDGTLAWTNDDLSWGSEWIEHSML